MIFLGGTILQGIEFPIFLLAFACALQHCSATALPVILITSQVSDSAAADLCRRCVSGMRNEQRIKLVMFHTRGGWFGAGGKREEVLTASRKNDFASERARQQAAATCSTTRHKLYSRLTHKPLSAQPYRHYIHPSYELTPIRLTNFMLFLTLTVN